MATSITVHTITNATFTGLEAAINTYFSVTLTPGTFSLKEIIFGNDTTSLYYATIVTIPTPVIVPSAAVYNVAVVQGTGLVALGAVLQTELNNIIASGYNWLSVDLIEVAVTGYIYFTTYLAIPA